MAGRAKPAPLLALWVPPAGWEKPSKLVSSWYDRGERLQPEEGAEDLLAQRRLKAARGDLKRELEARRLRATRAVCRQQVLALAARLNRGSGANSGGVSEQERAEMEALVKELEGISPIQDPLSSAEINGRWQLAYTTSASIIGIKKRIRPFGPIYQTLDVPTLTARNDDVVGAFGLRFRRYVKATLEPDATVRSKVTVRFRRFGLGPISFAAPKRAVGELDTTYLDDGLRVSRGDKGNLFVLFKDDPS